jgi:hypothetical protein
MIEAWRTVRVFISSTFKDMQAERDHLVRFVFPRLREELLKRRIHFVDVDLRWGVTSDQDAFDLCMDEIDRCQPRFLCMLGGRYGWVPPGADKSITASEVLHGALDRLDQPTFRYFYFRNDEVTDSIPAPDHYETYRERPDSPGASDLETLKNLVRTSTHLAWHRPDDVIQTEHGVEWKDRSSVVEEDVPYFTYPCRWDPATRRIVDLQEFGDRVYDDLMASIDAEFGTELPEELDRLAEESAALEAFVEDRVEAYVIGSRQPVLHALREHAEGRGENSCACVVGDPGSGKSALLGKFYRDQLKETEAIVLPHFVGINATDLREMLWRLCSELKERAALSIEVSTDIDGLRKTFPEALESAGGGKRVVVILDAVNQLDTTHGAHSMTWLPDQLPANVRVVLSSLPGPALDALRRRGSPPVEVRLEPLKEADATEIIDQFLDRYRKALDSAQRKALLGKEDHGNPLYLLTALEELRTLGIYEEITDRIDQAPGKVRPLFDWILERLEGDPGFRDADGRLVGKELVERYCSYLSLGRSGMAQSELAALVAPGDVAAGGDPDALGNVAALRSLLRPYLMQPGQLLDFFHGQTREAVQARYLTENDKRRDMHADIARYFQTQLDPEGDGSCSGDSIRGLSELPYHLTEAGEFDTVTETLTNFRFLERKVSEVGVVEATDAAGNPTATYTGVYRLQDDYDHALSRMPGGGNGDLKRRPIILTPVDFGDGYVIRCPFCNTLVPFEEEWLDKEMACPVSGCGGPWKVNPFKAVRPSWAG